MVHSSYTRSERTEVNGMLTLEQRMQLDVYLAAFHTWTVGIRWGSSSLQLLSSFAPRIYRNGFIDFIAPYPADSPVLALDSSRQQVSFLVCDQEPEHRLEGYAHARVAQQEWERIELLAYLEWRAPGATASLGVRPEVMIFSPTYLRFYVRRAGSAFEVSWL